MRRVAIMSVWFVFLSALPAESADCNRNGIQDTEELAAGSPDCNENGIPDECELAPGTLLDYPNEWQNFPVSNRGVLRFVILDLDRDSDPDIAALGWDGISLVRNDAGTLSTVGLVPVCGSDCGEYQKLQGADLDGDGDIDLVLLPTTLPSPSLLFRNEGDFTLVEAGEVPGLRSDSLQVYPLHFFDLDGDRLLDVFEVLSRSDGSPSGSAVWKKNDGAWGFGARRLIPCATCAGLLPGVMDVDDDGDLDIGFIADERYVILLNDGHGNFQQGPQGVDTFSTPLLEDRVDFDGDGDIDRLRMNGVLRLNDGAGGFIDVGQSGVGFFPGWTQYLDMNEDGELDYSIDPDFAYIALWDQCAIAPIDPERGLDFVCVRGGGVDVWSAELTAVDFDLDRNGTLDECEDCNRNSQPDGLDLSSGSSVDTDGDGIPDECQDCNANGVPDGREIALGTAEDCNGNGVPDACDLVRSPPQFERQVYYRSDLETQNWVAGIPADLDADGDLDLGGWEVYWNDGDGGFLERPTLVPIDELAGVNFQADLDSDGLPELIGFNPFVPQLGITWNLGGRNFSAPTGLRLPGSFRDPIVALDVDGDGYRDLCVLQARENNPPGLRPALVINNQDGTFRFAGSVGDYVLSNQPFPSVLAAGDMDGDGADDVVTFDASFLDTTVLPARRKPAVVIFRNERDGSLATLPQVLFIRLEDDIEQISNVRLFVADWDGDDDKDVVVFFYRRAAAVSRQEMFLLRNLDSGQFDPPRSLGSWPDSQYIIDVLPGDFDADGDLDFAFRQFYEGADLEPKATVSFFLNDGQASFVRSASELDSPLPLDAGELLAADLDRRRGTDLVLVGSEGPIDSNEVQPFEDDAHGARSQGTAIFHNSTREWFPDCDASGTLDVCDIAAGSLADADADGVPDICQGGLQLPFDANQDGLLDLSDPVWLLGHLFSGSNPVLPCDGGSASAPEPGALSLLDSNGDGRIDLSDAVIGLSYLFLGGPPPVLGVECVSLIGCTSQCKG